MFSVGAVVRQAVQTFVHNFIPFTVLAMVGLLVIWVLVMAIFAGYDESLVALTDEQALAKFVESSQTDLLIRIVVVVIAAVAVLLAINASIVYGTIVDLRGQNASLGECASRGIGKVPAALAMSILFIFAVVAVMIALTFLGILLGLSAEQYQYISAFPVMIFAIVLMVRWYVAIPVLVVENLGVMAALKRSTDLTSGYGWQIFGLIAISAGLSWFISSLSVLFLRIFSYISANFIGLFFELALQSISVGFGAVLIAVVYHDLRVAKENVGTDDITSTLD